jgi:endonuclease/exonuclease/phosphatase family metal-dependent hydrolase
MMMYDIHKHLNPFNGITNDGSKYMVENFNINTRKTINIVFVYRVHSCSISAFLNKLQIIIQHSPEHYPIIIMGDFNVDILKDNNHGKTKQKLLDFMDKFKLKSQFNESTTKVGFQLDHIWANVLGNECKYSVI